MSKPLHDRRFGLLVWAASLGVSTLCAIISSLAGGKAYAISSALIVLCAVLPAFALFEHRRPQPREIALIATMCALAIASRIAFAAIPHFKPTAGIVMISGMGLGTGPGFLIGASAMLLSNLFFGMGPWAPWQMLSLGLCGAFGGAMAHALGLGSGRWGARRRTLVSLGCAAFFLVFAGPLLDTSTLFYMLSSLSPAAIIAVYAAGVPVNALQATATFLTVFLVGPPLLRRFAFIEQRFGPV